ncbi:Kinesin-like protein KIF21B [Choanephora cucurbitarum]|uniref:Kinesin-like protein KIF21B n=1 Tax=Choanephora cucurbitarum TaxID=101091 RepID=A0A1C7NIX9_9FUNG|nr:Kinesin-like protein KIF21B [Choanephora cucurbitarum]
MTKESSSPTTAVQKKRALLALRIRPLTDRDRAQPRFANLANDDVLKIFDKTVKVVSQNKLFTFDHVFGTESTQEEIFSTIGDQLIRKFIEGYNITILAYGQTSSGKTYTMGTAANGASTNSANEGIVPRSMALLFDLLHNNQGERPISPTSSISSSTTTSNKSGSRLRPKSRIGRASHVPQVSTNNSHSSKTKFTVKVSFIEIYNEDLHDLLNSAPQEELPPITIREDTKGRIYWTGVKEVTVHSTDDVLYYLEQGTQNRATGATDMNEKSSRSHAIFSVSLKQEKWIPSETSKKMARPQSSLSLRSGSNTRSSSAQPPEEGEWLITTSKFHFVDLAGSERLKRTAAEGDRRKEGININAGLLALGNVISALGDPSKKSVHVPYRDSKLTRLLQDSLGGSATTLMIACASPAEYNLAETVNTLQYANRARNIKNRSEKNQVEEWMTTENVELLRSIISKLKNELNYLKASKGSHSNHIDDGMDDAMSSTSSAHSMEEVYHEQRLLIADLQRQLEELDGEASVTRERNRMVEKELQRARLLESMSQNKQVDFQHLVEPVIEEYEKSVSKLESQLAMTKAALNHSEIGFEEQQTKINQLESLLRAQEHTINELRLRLSKVLEREQNNESYILELETKLMKSANETHKDQEMLNELKTRITKLRETDENTEQYIINLEQRLAASDAERNVLQHCIEDLEKKIEAKERTNVELLKRLSKTTASVSNEKAILQELDQVNSKYAELEKERDQLQQQIDQIQQARQSNSETSHDSTAFDDELTQQRPSSASSLGSIGNKKKGSNSRKSLMDESDTVSSMSALLQTESQLKEQTERANHLQGTLDRLRFDHEETVKELDEVLQRYHEAQEQLDFLERDSSTELPGKTNNDLSNEIAQATIEQEKSVYEHQIKELEHRVQSLTKKITIKDSELEIANDTIRKLTEQLTTTQKELEELKTSEEKEDVKGLLEQEKKQASHWKSAHQELKQDMDKLSHDLDEKEQFIAQLKERLDEDSTSRESLQIQYDQTSQQATDLQKKLAETTASLAVLRIAHDHLQTQLANEQAKQEAKDHPSELEQVQQDMNTKIKELNTMLAKATSDKETALEKLAMLEENLQHQTDNKDKAAYQAELTKLKSTSETSLQELKQQVQTLETQLETSRLLQEEMTADHEMQVNELTQNFENASRQLLEQITELENTLEQAKAEHESTLAERDHHITQLSQHFETATREMEEQISQLESELEASKELHQEILISHNERLRDATATIQQEQAQVQHDLQAKIKQLEDRLGQTDGKDPTEPIKVQLAQTQLALEQLEARHAQELLQIQSEHQKALEQEVSRGRAALKEVQAELEAIQQENQTLRDQKPLSKQISLHKNTSSDRVAEKIAQLESQWQPTPAKTSPQRQLERLQAQLKEGQEQIDRLRKEQEGASQVSDTLEALRRSYAEKEEAMEQQQERMTDLEKQIRRMQEDNLEYTALSGELEKEIHRMTEENEGLVEALEESEETVQGYKAKLEQLKSIVGSQHEDGLVDSVRRLKEESNNNGSGALSQNTISSADYDQLKKEHEEQMKQMVSLQQFEEQKQKYEASEKARKKLEKQLEELLAKKSSFLCF